jgi:hypothetical protein
MTAAITNDVRLGAGTKIFILPALALYSGDSKAVATQCTDMLYATAGKKKGALKAGVKVWGNLTEKNGTLKITQNAEKGDFQLSPERIIGISSTSVELSGEIYDVDDTHFIDMFSATGISTAAAVGIEGRTAIGIGASQTIPNDYMVIFQMPARKSISADGYDHWIIPAFNMVGKPELGTGKKDKLTMKFEGSGYQRAEINDVIILDLANAPAS